MYIFVIKTKQQCKRNKCMYRYSDISYCVWQTRPETTRDKINSTNSGNLYHAMECRTPFAVLILNISFKNVLSILICIELMFSLCITYYS